MPTFSRIASIAFLVSLVACSSSGTSTPPGASATKPANVTWCPSAPAATNCTAIDECGVCVATPLASLGDVKRTSDTKEYAGSGAVDVGCLQPTATFKKLDPTASKKVTMKGYAKIFANGPDSKNVKIEIYAEGANGALGSLLGTTVTDGTLPAGTKVEKIIKSGTEIERTLYPFELKDIPTETVLIIKTSGKTDADGWFNLYDYGIAARNDALVDGNFVYDVRALGNDDYASILKAAYSRPPEGGKGAIAGEVHDCGDVRLSNATVESLPKSMLGLFYLSEEEDNPLPDGARKATGKLGLYATGGLNPGGYQVAAAGRVSGTMTGLGTYNVQVFADSVTVITFRGRRAWQ